MVYIQKPLRYLKQALRHTYKEDKYGNLVLAEYNPLYKDAVKAAEFGNGKYVQQIAQNVYHGVWK
jgi:hypothetical protein